MARVKTTVDPSTNGQVAKQDNANFKEFGVPGAVIFGGQVWEERLPKLAGSRALEVYRQMYESDPVVGAVFLAIEQAMRSVRWKTDPENDTDAAKRDAEFVEENRNDMSHTWQDFMADVLSELVYGWSYFETVYKIRGGGDEDGDPTIQSRYDDRAIGWRKHAARSQTTLIRWIMDEAGGVQGMVQQDPNNPGRGEIVLPIRKCLHFKTKPAAGNPQGRSLLRNAFRPWYFKKFIEELEGIGIERDLAGLPKVIVPPGIDIFAPSMAVLYGRLTDLLKNVRQDKYAGVILPNGYEFELMSAAGGKQFDTGGVIARYDQRIAMVTLAQFIMLGSERVGSYALASQHKDLFTIALEGWLFAIEQVVNRFAVRRLIRLNGRSTFPTISHDPVVQPTLDEISTALRDLVSVGVITPDRELETWVRHRGAMPLSFEEGEREVPAGQGEEEETEQEVLEAQRKATLRRFDAMPERMKDVQALDYVLPLKKTERQFADAVGDDRARQMVKEIRRKAHRVMRNPLSKEDKRRQLSALFDADH